MAEKIVVYHGSSKMIEKPVFGTGNPNKDYGLGFYCTENKKSKLQSIRKARGFTQQQLSEASGVTFRMIQLYEQKQNDVGKAQVNVVLSLARVLGCEIEDLIE